MNKRGRRGGRKEGKKRKENSLATTENNNEGCGRRGRGGEAEIKRKRTNLHNKEGVVTLQESSLLKNKGPPPLLRSFKNN